MPRGSYCDRGCSRDLSRSACGRRGQGWIGATGGALTAFDALATTRLYPTSDSRVGSKVTTYCTVCVGLVGYTNSIATAVMTDDAHRGGEDRFLISIF